MIQVEEKTLELAMVKAASRLGITQRELEYKVISKSSGLLGIFGRKICIEAWPKAPAPVQAREARPRSQNSDERRHNPSRQSRSPRGEGQNYDSRDKDYSSRRPNHDAHRANARAASTTHERSDNARPKKHPQNTARPSRSENQSRQTSERPEKNRQRESTAPMAVVMPSSTQQEELRDFCRTLCAMMTGTTVQVTCEAESDQLTFDVLDDSFKDARFKKPKLIESLEHLLRKRLTKLIPGENALKIFVDINQSRKGHEAELISMAKDLSDKVSEKKKPIVLNYRNPFDRKIIHLALENDNRVYTKSIGIGRNRKLMILPSKS
jgi:spoIIIJ-associated protein